MLLTRYVSPPRVSEVLIMADIPRPQQAIDFLAKKVNVETDNWDELKWGEHAHAFTVAHSVNAGVNEEIHRLLNDAIENGRSFQQFRQGMLDMMKESGWYGGIEFPEIEEGDTEEEKRAKIEKKKQYINWRIGVIYDTNMKTAYAQQEYRDQLQGASLRPIWVYRSQLTGKNRRQEHINLHGKVFRYDDPFWDTFYPPNGWGCECYVETESEHSAEKAGIKVEESKNIKLPDIDPNWKYNVGREALAPNFNKYKNLPEDALQNIFKNFHRSMNHNRMSEGEFKTLLKRTNEADYKRNNIMYQVGNLEEQRYEAMRKAGILDSKIIATDNDLHHGTGDKTARQKVPENLFDTLYKTLGEPEAIYEEIVSGKSYRVFHFVTDTGDDKKIKILLHTTNLGENQTSLKISTMGYSTYEYRDKKYKKIW